MINLKTKMFNIIKGNASKKEEMIYVFISLFILFIGMTISELLYPGGFYFADHYISDHGWLEMNPRGAPFYIVCGTITGFLFIPHFIYMHKKNMPTAAFLTRLSTLFFIIGAIGFSMVALITKDEPTSDIHDIMSDLAFGGLGGGIFFMFLVHIRKLLLKESWPTILQFFTLYGITICLGIMVALISNSKVQQWMGFFTVLIWIILSFLLSPRESLVKK